MRLGNLFSHSSGKALNGGDKEGKPYQYITTSNLYWNRFELDNLRTMNFRESELEKCTATKGDLLVCEGGDIGRAAIWNYDYDIKIQNHIHKLRAFYPLCTKFFYYIFFLYKHIGFIGGKGIGIQGLSSGALHQIILPIAPLNEQMRIVEKIDEIMPIADKYAQTQQELDNLNSEIYDLLKKSILQEAIQGRLVPQDPNDEPAEVLLQRIKKEKERLVTEGKLKRKDIVESTIYRGDDNKYYEQINDKLLDINDEIPFDIPNSWVWCRLTQLVNLITGTSYDKSDVSNNGIRILRGGNVQNTELMIFDNDVFLPHKYEDNAKQIKVNDIIIVGSTGSKEVIGKPAFVLHAYSHTQIGAFLRIVRPYFEFCAPYLRIIFSSDYYRKHIRSKVKGTNINNIKAEHIERMLVPLPPLNEMNVIVSKVEKLYMKL